MDNPAQKEVYERTYDSVHCDRRGFHLCRSLRGGEREASHHTHLSTVLRIVLTMTCELCVLKENSKCGPRVDSHTRSKYNLPTVHSAKSPDSLAAMLT